MKHCSQQNPGPAYALASLTGYEKHDYTKYRAPAYSLGLKGRSQAIGVTPGPYKFGDVDRFGRYPYMGWTIESRGERKVRQIGPSPLSYAPEKAKYYTPAYSLGLKLHSKSDAFGPGPADYFPQYPQGNGFTIGSPFKKTSRFSPPGPNPAVPIDLYKHRAPAYSLGLKGRPLFGLTAGPGPKYYPGKIGKCIPHAYSFGLKHSECSPPMVTYDDNN